MVNTIFLAKAKRNIQAAQLLFDHAMYDESANRAYYAALQAASSALSKVGIQAEGMSHEAVQSAFSRELIHRRKIYPGRFKSYLSELLLTRNTADYKPRFTSRNAAAQQLQKAKEFFESVEKETTQ